MWENVLPDGKILIADKVTQSERGRLAQNGEQIKVHILSGSKKHPVLLVILLIDMTYHPTQMQLGSVNGSQGGKVGNTSTSGHASSSTVCRTLSLCPYPTRQVSISPFTALPGWYSPLLPSLALHTKIAPPADPARTLTGFTKPPISASGSQANFLSSFLVATS